MYKMTKNEIEMYVTTIHNAYPAAPIEAMDAMKERFAKLQLADNFLAEANAKMDTLNTAILINHMSRSHLSNEMALEVIRHFNDKRVTRHIHSQWPDEQMEERIQIVTKWNVPYDVPREEKNYSASARKRQTTPKMIIPASAKNYRILTPSIH